MDAVIDFLLEYYWVVLVVLVVLLITVIGFLADTKRKKKLRAKAESQSTTTNNNGIDNNNYPDFNNINQGNNQNLNMNTGFNNFNNNYGGTDFNIAPDTTNNMLNQNLNNGMQDSFNQSANLNQGINPNLNQNVNLNSNINPEFNANNIGQEPVLNQAPTYNEPVMPNTTIEGPAVNNSVNIPEVNNINSNLNNNDSFFVPASEQTPKIEPREVVIPKPVEPTPIMNNVNAVNSWDLNNNNLNNNIPNNTVNSYVAQTPVTPSVEPVNQYNQPMPNVVPTPVEKVPQQVQMPYQNNQGNINYNNTVAPTANTSINNINPLGEQSNQMQNMPNTQAINQSMPNTQGMPNNNFLSGGSNFVVGGTPTNNQMPSTNDNWKL